MQNHPSQDLDINDIYVQRDIDEEVLNTIEELSTPEIALDMIATKNTLRDGDYADRYNATNLEMQKEYKKKVLKFILIICIFSTYIGGYAGYLLFGNKSVETIINLKKQKQELNSKIVQSREENTRLQKQLLELRELEN